MGCNFLYEPPVHAFYQLRYKNCVPIADLKMRTLLYYGKCKVQEIHNQKIMLSE